MQSMEFLSLLSQFAHALSNPTPGHTLTICLHSTQNTKLLSLMSRTLAMYWASLPSQSHTLFKTFFFHELVKGKNILSCRRMAEEGRKAYTAGDFPAAAQVDLTAFLFCFCFYNGRLST